MARQSEDDDDNGLTKIQNKIMHDTVEDMCRQYPQMRLVHVVVYGKGKVLHMNGSFSGQLMTVFVNSDIYHTETLEEARTTIKDVLDPKENYMLWDATDPTRVVCLEIVRRSP